MIVYSHMTLKCHGVQSYSFQLCDFVQGNASEPKSWHVQLSRKKSTAAEEEDILLLQDMQDVLLACEMDADDASADMEKEEDGGGTATSFLMSWTSGR